MSDLEAIDPDTGNLLFVDYDNDGNQIYKNAHQLKHIALCETTEAPETKDVNRDVFHPFYRQIEPLSTVGIPASNGWPEIKPLICRVCVDGETAWSIIGIGGPFKNREYACHCCEAKEESLHSLLQEMWPDSVSTLSHKH